MAFKKKVKAPGEKKRGRKAADDDEYILESKRKITEWQDALLAPGVDQKERNRIKNRISAQESRMKKREEQKSLGSKVETSTKQWNAVLLVINQFLEKLGGDRCECRQ